MQNRNPGRAREEIAGILRHWLKFNFVGAIGIVVQVIALSLFVSVFRINYLWATGLAVEVAVLHNCLWHERFTWGERTRRDPGGALRRLLRFNLTTGLISIVGNLALMRGLVGGAGMKPVAANLIAIAVLSLANFVVSHWFVFRSVYPAR